MPETDSDSTLDEVFGAVADETRLAILRALWEERTAGEGRDRDPVSFSTLRDAVGVKDSGRFNYHLDQLVPNFVHDAEDGYRLTYAGRRIIGAAVSGAYTDTGTELEATPVGPCSDPECDGEIAARYGAGTVSVECDTCDAESAISAPPILVGAHDPAKDPDVLDRFVLTVIQKTIRGFCRLCSGPMEARVARGELDGWHDEGVTVVHECQECGSTSYTPAVATVIDHPAVVSLLHDAGIDYRDGLLWRETDAFDWEESVVDEDPVRVAVTIRAGGEELVVTLDGTLDVVEYGDE